MMQIDFANLQLQYQKYKSDIDNRIQQVLHKSNYIMGQEVAELEQQLAEFTTMDHALSCSNGTDALKLAMLALDIQSNDEVITTAFSFIASAESIALLKAKPVFVDIQADTFNIDPTLIEAAISPRTKAIIAVNLYGQPADLKPIWNIAKAHKLKLIVDGAQCFGSIYKGKNSAHFSDIYTTSFFPSKPLGCYGDGGAVLTNNAELANNISQLRIHGQNQRYQHQNLGLTGRLDTIQAAVLLAKLPHYAKEIERRQAIAERYKQALKNTLETPLIKADRQSVWAQYTLQTDHRDALQSHLSKQGIPTAIHYPMGLHQQACFAYLGYPKHCFPVTETIAKRVLSLPMNAFLSDPQIDFICQQIVNFYQT